MIQWIKRKIWMWRLNHIARTDPNYNWICGNDVHLRFKDWEPYYNCGLSPKEAIYEDLQYL